MSRLVTVLLLLALAGCSAAPTALRSPPRPAVSLTASAPAPLVEPVEPVEPAPTYLDLVAALPTGAALAPWTLVDKCLAVRLSCARDGRARIARVSAEGRTSAEVSEHLLLQAVLYPSPEAAARGVRRWHHDVARQVRGHFDQPARDTGDGFDFGYVGDGTIGPFSLGAWVGHRASATLRYRHPDGRRSARTAYAEVLLRRGAVTVQVNLRRFIAGPGPPAAERLDELLAPVLAALGED